MSKESPVLAAIVVFDKPVGSHLPTVRELITNYPPHLKLPVAQENLLRHLAHSIMVSDENPAMIAVHCDGAEVPGFDPVRERFFFEKWFRDRVEGRSVALPGGEWLFVVGCMCGEPRELQVELESRIELLRRVTHAR